MATDIDWNMIELTEIYEHFDTVLGLLEEDFERARRVIAAAIKHGATPESMVEPIEEFAIELHAFCENINGPERQKQNKTQDS